MLPQNTSSLIPIPGAFLSPDDKVSSFTTDWERGGIAVGDASQGLQVQNWKAWMLGQYFMLQADNQDEPVALFTYSGAVSMSFCFDQNMRPAVVFVVTNGHMHLRWFDTAINNYRIDDLGVGRNARLALDDKRSTQSSTSDMILGYVEGRSLCYRQQRDRFQIEYVVRSDLPTNATLRNIGMGKNWRFQFEVL